MKDCVEFVKIFLGKDYKFDFKIEFVYDLDKKFWFKDGNEVNDFLKKYIYF